jgi:hypothetical protein
MLSVLITGSLLGVMLLVVASLVISALQQQRRYQQDLKTRVCAPAPEPGASVTMQLRVRGGVLVGVEKPAPAPVYYLPSGWYTRRRTLVSLSFLLMLFLALFLQNGLADGAFSGLSHSFSLLGNYQSNVFSAAAQPPALTASRRLARVDSANRGQYYSGYQFQVWSYASCSGISMEEVMNAYGRHLIAADVLQVEQNMGVWNSSQGLLGGEPSIAKVANYFGFKASPNPPRNLTDLISVANRGAPVIVGIPGHIMVVRGGDDTYVYLADSSLANRIQMTHQAFLSNWNNFSVLLTPQ